MGSFRVTTFDEWRLIARKLLTARIPPEAVQFSSKTEQRELFQDADVMVESSQLAADPNHAVAVVPAAFIEIARLVVCHRDPDRFDLLYRVLWRLTNTEPQLLEIVTDDDIHRLTRLEKAVRRDAHKMKAFVRFRRVVDADGDEQFIAWHHPDHRIVRLVAPFFARRFRRMNWTILTSDESVSWNQQELIYGPGFPREAAPQSDELEQLWQTYYGSIFNPARIKLKAMKREMPVRHWSTLPETEIIDDLLAEAPRRVAEMISRQEGYAHSAVDFFPAGSSWEDFRLAVNQCQACDLYRHATQAVFGEGPVPAKLMLVGEQPGDQEDQDGRPFVGPAGQILDDAMKQADLNRAEAYVTNTVKHFKFEPQGTRRLHKKPDAREMSSCRPWVEQEIQLVKPKVLVCLGATAAHALIGRDFKITQDRGTIVTTEWCAITIGTFHPSAVLRSRDPGHAADILAALVQDLKLVSQRLADSN